MRKTLYMIGAVSALAISTSAQAAVIINASDAVGTEYIIDFTGQVKGAPAPALSSLLTLTFNGTSNGGNSYNFSYSLLNDSTVGANLRSFGFDVSGGNFTGATSTGFFNNVGYNNNFPEGMGTLDVCFRSNGNGNCTGGQGGTPQNGVGTGTFALNFSDLPSNIALDNITTRYQSINPTINGGNSGIGIGTPVTGAVPEPSSWALMILGFGTVGMAMRRRKVTRTVAYS